MSHSRTSRHGRLAKACRFASTVLFVALASIPAASAADGASVAGNIFDPNGRPIPRAHVRVLDASGHETAATFTDDAGHFQAAASANCRVEATLTGFEPAVTACASTPLRLVLAVAPIGETVTVTATNTDAPTSQTGASTSVFTAADMEARREPFVADLLRSTPGAMVVGTGAPGGVTSLFVRGGDSDYNKVLLDGIPLNEPGGTFNFSNLSTDNLDRVEIVRGAQSALYGSDAMASVVQLFTKRADPSDPHPHASATIEGGSFDTVNATTAVTGANGRLDYMLGATRFATDNQVPNDTFTNSSLTANVGINLGHGATLRAIGRAELEHTGVPGPTAFGRPDLDAFFERHDGVGGVTFEQRVSPSFHERASYSLSVSNQVSTDLVLNPPFTAQYQGHVAPYVSTDFLYDSTTNLQRHYANYEADMKLPHFAHADHLVTVLADWNGERIHLVDRIAVTDTRESRNNFGAAVQEQALWSRVFVTAGGRVEHNASFGTAAVPRASAVFVAHQGRGRFGDTNLRASAGLGIKEPKAIESFSLSPYYLGNPNLLPERSRSFEFGIDQRFAGDRAKLQATWFDNLFHNQIALSAPDANFFSQYINVGESRARGAEIGLEVVPVPMLRARGGYTFLDSSVITSTSPTNPLYVPGSELFRRPRHSGFVGVTFTRDRLALDVNGVLVHSYVDSDFESFVPPITQNPGYTAWNGRVSYKVSRQVSLLGSMDNIGNASYMEPLGYPALGRAGRVGLKIGF